MTHPRSPAEALSDEEIAELEGLEAAATPGPWDVEIDNNEQPNLHGQNSREPSGRVEIVQGMAGEADVPGLVIRAAPGATAPLLRVIAADGRRLDLLPDLTWVVR